MKKESKSIRIDPVARTHDKPAHLICDVYVQIDARAKPEYFYVPSHMDFLGWRLPYRLRVKLHSGL